MDGESLVLLPGRVVDREVAQAIEMDGWWAWPGSRCDFNKY